MVNNFDKLFESESGKKIYSTIEKTVSEHNMLDAIKSGVLVGLSGGADSIMLLAYLHELKKSIGHFSIVAVHVNHMIRSFEADRDEKFSCDVARELNVDFISKKLNVPEIARNEGLSLEEAARNARYSVFSDVISSRDDVSAIAVAHNATDNVETVLFNILRGSGTKGAAGIRPVRQNIIRPLINVSKSDIVSALEESGIEYVVDSTNLESDYSRNYIRNKVLPILSDICSEPEKSVSRLSANLRSDDEYISIQADKFLGERTEVSTKELAELHRSLLYRVLSKMTERYSVTLEQKHIESISSLLSKDNFEVSLPGGLRFVSERGIAWVANDSHVFDDYCYFLKSGKNDITEFNSIIYLSDEKFDKTSLKVYKNSIYADLSSAIIVGSLFIRPKRDGDVVFYNGMTHKLKKLFNDRKIPKSKRPLIPVLCDEKGIVWVPGFGVRDDRQESEQIAHDRLFIALTVDNNNKHFYIPSNK